MKIPFKPPLAVRPPLENHPSPRGYTASRSALTLGEQLVEAQQSGDRPIMWHNKQAMNWWSIIGVIGYHIELIYIYIYIILYIYTYMYIYICIINIYIYILSYYIGCRHSCHFFQTQMLPQPFSAPWSAVDRSHAMGRVHPWIDDWAPWTSGLRHWVLKPGVETVNQRRSQLSPVGFFFEVGSFGLILTIVTY